MGPPGQPWAGLSGFWGFPPFLALVETVAVAVHLQDMNVVCEPVQQRPSQALGTEHLGPLIEELLSKVDGAVKSRFLMRVGWIIIVHVYFTRPTDWGIV